MIWIGSDSRRRMERHLGVHSENGDHDSWRTEDGRLETHHNPHRKSMVIDREPGTKEGGGKWLSVIGNHSGTTLFSLLLKISYNVEMERSKDN